MLGKYFNAPARLKRLRDSPLGALLESFAQELCDARYARFTACSHLRAAKHFIDWAGRKGVPIARVDEAVVERFDRYLTQHGVLAVDDGLACLRQQSHGLGKTSAEGLQPAALRRGRLGYSAVRATQPR